MGRVLIVDDDTGFVEVVRRRLTKAGHEAVAVTRGNLAFQAVVRHQPDVIILDVVMPVMGRLAVLSKLKSNTGTADIPVIMVTSQDNPQVQARSLSKGAAAFLTKPLRAGKLESEVRRLHGGPVVTAPKVATPWVALTGHEEAGSEGPGQDLALEPHDCESVAREFIGERYGFTWQDEYQKISEVRIQIKKVNRDDIRRIYQLARTAEVIVKDDGIPVPKAFTLAAVMDQEGMVVDQRGEFFDQAP